MNYNNPNQSGQAPFPYQYGQMPGNQNYGAPQPPQAGAPPSGMYPNLAGFGQQAPMPPYGGAGAPVGYPPQSNQPYPQPPPSQSYPQPQMPYGAGPPGPSAYQPSPYQQPYPQQGYRPNYNAPFDERAYLQKLFSDIDSNRDGRITGQELHEALRRGQPTAEFDPYTIQTLIQKYDADRDNQIAFGEFASLFGHLNAQLNEFYDFDSDNSGSIDGRELGNIMRRKGYNFSPDLFNFIVYEIARRSGKPQGVTFDTYVRVIARFDFLRDTYNRSPQIKQSVPLEKYIRDSFF